MSESKKVAVGLFLNHCGWTDVEPYEIVKVISDKTVEIRHMKSERLDDPQIIPGGFAGHCVNQHSMRYNITSDPAASVIRCRMTKKGWKSSHGKHELCDRPIYFYDYNF